MRIAQRHTAIVLVAALMLMAIPELAAAESKPTVRLAATGFDSTWPVSLGIDALLLGIVLVGWAFLRNPDRRSESNTRGDSPNDQEHSHH